MICKGGTYIKTEKTDVKQGEEVFGELYKAIKNERIIVIDTYQDSTPSVRIQVLTGPHALETFHLWREQLENEEYFKKEI